MSRTIKANWQRAQDNNGQVELIYDRKELINGKNDS